MSVDQLYVALFIGLFIADVYLMARLFASVDRQRFAKFKLLGPFVFLLPGVLERGGRIALIAVAVVSTLLFIVSLAIFDPDAIPGM